MIVYIITTISFIVCSSCQNIYFEWSTKMTRSNLLSEYVFFNTGWEFWLERTAQYNDVKVNQCSLWWPKLKLHIITSNLHNDVKIRSQCSLVFLFQICLETVYCVSDVVYSWKTNFARTFQTAHHVNWLGAGVWIQIIQCRVIVRHEWYHPYVRT